MDRRQQKTRESIFNAFNILLAQKKYSKITVQEIIDEANVGRSTFYSHFSTKDELLDNLSTDLFEHVFSTNLSTEITHDFSTESSNSLSTITHILYHLKENINIILSILNSESSDIFLKSFKKYLNKMLVPCILYDRKQLNKDLRKDFLTNHISGSFIEMVYWWIDNNLEIIPEELAEQFLFVISPIF